MAKHTDSLARRHRPRTRWNVEPLEERRLLSISVQIDYRFDQFNFFSSNDRRDALQQAFNDVASRLGDSLLGLSPSGNSHYTIETFNPSNLSNIEIEDYELPADTLVIFAGGAPQGPLGQAAPATTSATGGQTWRNRVETRGEQNVSGETASDFAPVGGSITFGSTVDWYFGLDPAGIGNRTDFYSVAQHEFFHVLGIGSSDSWEADITGSAHFGSAVVYEHGGPVGVSTNDGFGHFTFNTMSEGQEVIMDPDLQSGVRKKITALDLAGLDDVGWEIPLTATLAANSTFPNAGSAAATFSVTFNHYVPVPLGTFGNDDIVVTGPGGFSAPATLVSTGVSSKSRTVVYSFPAPGGTFDSNDSGAYTITLLDSAVGDGLGNAAPPGDLGTISVQVNTGPTAVLSVENITRIGGAVHVLDVTYTDPTGIDEASIGAPDITVSRIGDGLPVVVSSGTITGTTDSGAKTVRYVVSAPGGLWDAGDNGTYSVSLAGSQVNDLQGVFSDSATLGSFDVAITARSFSAGQPLSFTDATGDAVVISMSGPGGGQAFFDGTGNANLVEIILNNAAVSSALTVNASGAGTTIPLLTVNGSLKSFTGRNTDLNGTMTIAGPAAKIQLRNASGSLLINGSSNAAMSIIIAEASDLTITSATPVKSFKVNNWQDPDSTRDALSAPSIGTLAVKGTMAADVIADSIGKVTVGGDLTGSEIRSSGSITSLVVGAIAHSAVFAGVQAGVSTLPDDASDFTNAAALITTFTVRSKLPGSFSDTIVAGANLGRTNLGAIDTTNGGATLGVAALTARSVIAATDSIGPLKGSKLDAPTDSVSTGDFILRLL